MRRKFRWDVKYLYWGITAFCVIMASITFFVVLNEWSGVRAFIGKIFGVLSPVTFGFMFAYVLNKVMTFLERHFLARLSARIFKKPKTARRAMRITSVTLTMLIAVLVIGGTLILILPQIVASFKSLANKLPEYFDIAVNWTTGVLEGNAELESIAINIVGNITDWLTNWIQTTFLGQIEMVVSSVLSGVFGVIRAIANIAIGFIISVYVIYHKEQFSAQSKRIVYGVFKARRANKIIRGAQFLDKTCGSFITGKLIDTLIVGVVCYLFMIIVGMPYAVLISVIIGITNMIPFFGPFIGGVPSGLLILLENPPQCLIFVIFIIVLQQLDGNILYPKIQGNSIGMSGFWVMFSILFFGGLFGFWGMLFGVPVFAVIYAIIKGINTAQLKRRGLPTETGEYKEIYVFDEATNAPVYKHAHGGIAAPEPAEAPEPTEEKEDSEDDSEAN